MKTIMVLICLLFAFKSDAGIIKVAEIQSGKQGLVAPIALNEKDSDLMSGLEVCVLSLREQNTSWLFRHKFYWLKTGKVIDLGKTNIKSPIFAQSLSQCGLLADGGQHQIISIEQLSSSVCIVQTGIFGFYLYDTDACNKVMNLPAETQSWAKVDEDGFVYSVFKDGFGAQVYYLSLKDYTNRSLFYVNSNLGRLLAWNEENGLMVKYKKFGNAPGVDPEYKLYEESNKSHKGFPYGNDVTKVADHILVLQDHSIGLGDFRNGEIDFLWQTKVDRNYSWRTYDLNRGVMAFIAICPPPNTRHLLVLDIQTGDVLGSEYIDYGPDLGRFFFDEKGFLHVQDNRQFKDHVLWVEK